MKKSSLFSLIAMAALIFLPLFAMAQMSAISDSQLEAIVGQDGITIDMTLDAYIQLISYGDTDGFSGSSAGYLNIAQLAIPDTGTINLTGLTVDVETTSGISRLAIGLPTISGGISIGAIRVGSAATSTSGSSIGTVSISGLNLSGSTIYVRGH
ncbi:MAG: hypothetical protein SWO11_04830 [Thermodesulfobacteriota bacterium]|nr:hypothetical protein [Thermodesulfobacteriota bacterium]